MLANGLRVLLVSDTSDEPPQGEGDGEVDSDKDRDISDDCSNVTDCESDVSPNSDRDDSDCDRDDSDCDRDGRRSTVRRQHGAHEVTHAHAHTHTHTHACTHARTHAHMQEPVCQLCMSVLLHVWDRPPSSKPPLCPQSAAALCVSVGSFSDPPEIPGLAHFLEHSMCVGGVDWLAARLKHVDATKARHRRLVIPPCLVLSIP